MSRFFKSTWRVLTVAAFIPVELVGRIVGHKWVLDETVTYVSPEGWTLTAEKGMRYDQFTAAPNLRQLDGKPSRACAIHDQGWNTGIKDDGTMLTFDENNAAFVDTLDKEDHPQWVRNSYKWGVERDFMRNKWRKTFGHE